MAELDQFFVLDDEDLMLIGKRRRDSSRLGFAAQLTSVRYVGAFLDDPLDVPAMVLDVLATQLGIDDASCVKSYVERKRTHWEHRREICDEVGWRECSEASGELFVWLERRCWNTGESSATLFFGAIAWLRARQVLLPGMTTLKEQVRKARRPAETRLWASLVEQITAQQARLLLGLLEVPDESRKSPLEMLRRGPLDRSGKALVAALNRIVAVAGLGVSGVGMGVVPQRRVRELARDGLLSNATALRRRRPYDK